MQPIAPPLDDMGRTSEAPSLRLAHGRALSTRALGGSQTAALGGPRLAGLRLGDTYLFGAISVLTPLVLLCLEGVRRPQVFLRMLVPCLVPLTLVAMGLLLYTFVRFGSFP